MTTRALIQRINRKLRQDDETLKVTRGLRAEADLGYAYILDVNRNVIVAHHVDIGELARELKVLKPFEREAP